MSKQYLCWGGPFHGRVIDWKLADHEKLPVATDPLNCIRVRQPLQTHRPPHPHNWLQLKIASLFRLHLDRGDRRIEYPILDSPTTYSYYELRRFTCRGYLWTLAVSSSIKDSDLDQELSAIHAYMLERGDLPSHRNVRFDGLGEPVLLKGYW